MVASWCGSAAPRSVTVEDPISDGVRVMTAGASAVVKLWSVPTEVPAVFATIGHR